MKLSPFPLSNRAFAYVIWIALISCGPPVWRGGIHALLAWSPNGVRVVEVPPSSPAERGGLRADDRVVTIDGRPTAGMTQEQVQQRLSGEVGSTVALEVLRGEQRLELYIAREPYEKPTALPMRGY